MKKKINIYINIAFLYIIMLPIGLLAQGLSDPGVTPSMLSQFSSMTPDQRRELASQYGINLEDMGLSDGSLAPNNIGMTGSELISESNQIILDRIIEAQKNTKKAD